MNRNFPDELKSMMLKYGFNPANELPSEITLEVFAHNRRDQNSSLFSFKRDSTYLCFVNTYGNEPLTLHGYRLEMSSTSSPSTLSRTEIYQEVGALIFPDKLDLALAACERFITAPVQGTDVHPTANIFSSIDDGLKLYLDKYKAALQVFIPYRKLSFKHLPGPVYGVSFESTRYPNARGSLGFHMDTIARKITDLSFSFHPNNETCFMSSYYFQNRPQIEKPFSEPQGEQESTEVYLARKLPVLEKFILEITPKIISGEIEYHDFRNN